MKMAAVLFLLFCAFSAEVTACTCGLQRPEPCEAYRDASAIFVGTVTYSSEVPGKEGNYPSGRVVRFNIDEAFRGLDGTEAEVFISVRGPACRYRFLLGGQYLVYAYRQKDGSLSSRICTTTRAIGEAEDDLAYLRGLSSVQPGATIFGSVLARDSKCESHSVKGVRIFIQGQAKSVDATTDEKGRYRVSGLPPGTYKVSIAPPEGVFSDFSSEREAKVVDRGCAQTNFWIESDRRITGRVVDANGLPAPDLFMELVSSDDKVATEPKWSQSTFENRWHRVVKTDADGKYEFPRIKSGHYWLGVRIYGSEGSTDMPYPRTYYPGVADKAQAKIINVTDGAQIKLNELILPPRLVESTLEGIVMDPDGRPMKGATVFLKEREYADRDMPYTLTDEQGRFSFKVYQGINYFLRAFVGDFKDNGEVSSEGIEIRVDAKQSEKILVLETDSDKVARTKQAEAEQELELLRTRQSPRSISENFQEELKSKPVGEVVVVYVGASSEVIMFTEALCRALKDAGWTVPPPTQISSVLDVIPEGRSSVEVLVIYKIPEGVRELPKHVQALSDALSKERFSAGMNASIKMVLPDERPRIIIKPRH